MMFGANSYFLGGLHLVSNVDSRRCVVTNANRCQTRSHFMLNPKAIDFLCRLLLDLLGNNCAVKQLRLILGFGHAVFG